MLTLSTLSVTHATTAAVNKTVICSQY